MVDLDTAIGFVLEPKAGPLGRHVALASFLINASSWDVVPEDFLHVNVCIHLLNGMLLMWIVLRLARLLDESEARASGMAVFVAALWLCSPLLVSATLMVVQRMTTLSATFALLGVLGFVTGFEVLRREPVRGYLWMSAAVVLGTLLAMFTKENGVLLPMLLWVLSVTLLAGLPQGGSKGFRYWRAVFLVLPSVAILSYLAAQLPGIAGLYERRDFSFEQRILTEARILMRYLALVIVPVRAKIGPFQDDYPLSDGIFDPPVTALAIFCIMALLAVAIAARRRAPVLAFAILWFFAGHVLESTVIPLEIYFEHRNYLPAIGPVFAVVWGIYRIRRPCWGAPTLLSVYGALMASVCLATTSVFGDATVSALLWSREHPDSVRATQHLAVAYVSQGKFDAAARLISDFSDRNGREVGLVVQSLQLACIAGNADQRLQEIKTRPDLLRSGHPNSIICSSFEKMVKLAMEGYCEGVRDEDFHWLADQIRQNPRMASASEVNYCLHDMQAMIHFNDLDFQGTMEHLDAAFQYRKYWPLAQRMIEVPLTAGRVDLARANFERVRAYVPPNPIHRRIWQRNLAEYDQLFRRLEEPRGGQ